jgi:hypothetical protein
MERRKPVPNNVRRHIENLNRLTGWYKGHYYINGMRQSPKVPDVEQPPPMRLPKRKTIYRRKH